MPQVSGRMRDLAALLDAEEADMVPLFWHHTDFLTQNSRCV